MSSRYTADGKRKSSMTHARRGHTCDLCGAVSYGNGGRVSHARSHVRRGEAVELIRWYPDNPSPGRVFVAITDVPWAHLDEATRDALAREVALLMWQEQA